MTAAPVSARSRVLAAAALLLAGSVGETLCRRLEAHVRGGRDVELSRPMSDLPIRLGEWSGRDLPIDPRIEKVIGGDGCFQRIYTHPGGQQCVLWMSYSRRSKDQYHFPTVCMPGGGWAEDESVRGRLKVDPFGDGRAPDPVPIHRMLFQKQGQRQLVYYWYYLMGEDAFDRFMRGQSAWARAFIRGRKNASMTVEVFSQSSAPDPRRLDEFVRLVARELDRFVPPGSAACCDLGAL